MLEIGCAWSKSSGERLQGHHGPLVFQVQASVVFSSVKNKYSCKLDRPILLLSIIEMMKPSSSIKFIFDGNFCVKFNDASV